MRNHASGGGAHIARMSTSLLPGRIDSVKVQVRYCFQVLSLAFCPRNAELLIERRVGHKGRA